MIHPLQKLYKSGEHQWHKVTALILNKSIVDIPIMI